MPQKKLPEEDGEKDLPGSDLLEQPRNCFSTTPGVQTTGTEPRKEIAMDQYISTEKFSTMFVLPNLKPITFHVLQWDLDIKRRKNRPQQS